MPKETQGFPVERRIRTAKQYQQVFSQRKRIMGPFYSLCYKAVSQKRPHLGVIVSKRNVKRAVGRNKLKRLAREQFRQQQSLLAEFDIVLIGRKQADQATNQELIECLNKLFANLVKRSKSSSLA